MLFNKKGVELSMNVIIIAALGVLVLVILSVLIFGGAIKLNIGIDDCSKMDEYDCSQGLECEEGYTKHPTRRCYESDGTKDDNNVCCIKQKYEETP